MFPHGADQDFRGKRKKILGKTSPDGQGVLHQIGHDFQELFVRKDGSGNFRSRFMTSAGISSLRSSGLTMTKEFLSRRR